MRETWPCCSWMAKDDMEDTPGDVRFALKLKATCYSRDQQNGHAGTGCAECLPRTAGKNGAKPKPSCSLPSKRRAWRRFKTSILELLPESELFTRKIPSQTAPPFFVAELIRERYFYCSTRRYLISGSRAGYPVRGKEHPHQDHREDHRDPRKRRRALFSGKKEKASGEIGSQARVDIEKFLDRKVFLELHVKVASQMARQRYVPA